MKQSDAFETFRAGMAAGHEASQTEDLIYILGFAAGFLWGFFLAPRMRRGRVESIGREAPRPAMGVS